MTLGLASTWLENHLDQFHNTGTSPTKIFLCHKSWFSKEKKNPPISFGLNIKRLNLKPSKVGFIFVWLTTIQFLNFKCLGMTLA